MSQNVQKINDYVTQIHAQRSEYLAEQRALKYEKLLRDQRAIAELGQLSNRIASDTFKHINEMLEAVRGFGFAINSELRVHEAGTRRDHPVATYWGLEFSCPDPDAETYHVNGSPVEDLDATIEQAVFEDLAVRLRCEQESWLSRQSASGQRVLQELEKLGADTYQPSI